MKKLILIRHGKSDWDFPVQDFERKLTEKGILKSIKVAKETQSFIDNKSLIISSYANRALSTAKIVVENWGLDIDSIQIEKELYTFDSIKLEQIVKSCHEKYDSLILFGHNSAITDFVNKFGNIFIDNVPTSGFVSIVFDVDNWNKIDKGTTNKIVFPSDI